MMGGEVRAYGLVVGINRYRFEDDSAPNLTTPENDARHFYEWATSARGGGTKKTVHLLPGAKSSLLSKRAKPRPVHEQIEDKLVEIIGQAASRGGAERFYFFFSGHGTVRDLTAEGLVLPNWRRDTTPGRSLELVSYLQCLRAAPFREQFFFIDACRNFKDVIPGHRPTYLCDGWQRNDTNRVADPGVSHQVVLYAAGRSQTALQELGDEHSYFTSALIDGLDGAPEALTVVDGIPAVTVGSLLRFVQSRVAPRAHGNDRTQRPELMTDYDSREPVLVHFPGEAARWPPLEVLLDPKDNPPPRLHVKLVETSGAESRTVAEQVIEGISGTVLAPTNGVFRILAYVDPNNDPPWGRAVFDAEDGRRQVRIQKTDQSMETP